MFNQKRDNVNYIYIIIVAIVIFEAVMEILHMYKNLVTYENGDDYIRYVLGSIIACIIVSTIHVFLTYDVDVIRTNIFAFVIVAMETVSYRVIIRAMRREQIINMEELYLKKC